MGTGLGVAVAAGTAVAVGVLVGLGAAGVGAAAAGSVLCGKAGAGVAVMAAWGVEKVMGTVGGTASWRHPPNSSKKPTNHPFLHAARCLPPNVNLVNGENVPPVRQQVPANEAIGKCLLHKKQFSLPLRQKNKAGRAV